MHELISYLQTFEKPPFLALPKKLEMVFLRYVEEQKILMPCRFINLEDYLDIIESASVDFLKTHYDMNYYLISRMMNVLPNIPVDTVLPTSKLQTLQTFKKALVSANLITKNDVSLLRDHPIVIAYYPTYDKVLETGQIHYFTPKAIPNKLLDLIISEDEFAQIHTAIEIIYQLLTDQKDINHIKIVNATKEDVWLLHKEAQMYGFSVDDGQNIPLDSHPLAIEVIKSLETMTLEEALIALANKIKTNPMIDTAVNDAFIHIINKHSLEVLENNHDLLRFEIEQATLPPIKKTNIVEIVSINDAFVHPNDHYIVLNYTDSLFPSLKKDDDYLSDDEKTSLNLRTSIEENKLIINDLKARVLALKDVTFLMPEKNKGKEMRRSDLFSEKMLRIHAHKADKKCISGSESYDLLDYAKKTYAFNQFNQLSADYSDLHSTFYQKYRRYDPKFKGISNNTLNQLLKQGFTFSPTNLERFNACHFRFLLDFLLQILKEEPKDSILYGNLAHHILSKTFQSTQSINELKEEYLNKLQVSLSDSMKIHLDLFVNRIETVIDYLKAQEINSTFQDYGFELGLDGKIKNQPNFSMKGKIDRVRILNDDDKSYFSVIDYKTGVKKFNFNQFEQGINIQPIFYLNLLKKNHQTPKFNPFGFFYQGVNLKRLNKTEANDEIKQALKMNGVALNNPRLVTAFSPSITITGMKLTKDGSFGKSDKLVDESTLESMIDYIDILIEKAIDTINKGDFSITPLAGKDDFDDSPACKYCPHSAICFMKNRFILSDDDESEERE